MSLRYSKQGVAVRYENGVVVTARESGEAWLEGDVFHARPTAHPAASLDVDAAPVLAVVERIRSVLPSHVTIERLIASDGIAEHQYGERTWRDATRRLHASLVNGRERMLIDCGDFDVENVLESVALFGSIGPEGEPPPELRLAPRVAAAVVPMFLHDPPAGVTLLQAPRGVDGNGEPVVGTRLESPPWQNTWRPSYRVRPVRVPMHVMAEHDHREIDSSLPVAVALLRAPSSRLLRVMIRDGRRCWASEIVVERIRAIGEAQEWYPFHAGSFGAEMVL